MPICVYEQTLKVEQRGEIREGQAGIVTVEASRKALPSNQVKVAPRVLNHQRLRIGLIVFEVKTLLIEEAEIDSVTSGFGDCRGEGNLIARRELPGGIASTAIAYVREMCRHAKIRA
jgi:hypothetical protein